MGFGRGLENEAGIGRRVLRLELPHGFEIAGVRDDFREFLKLIELAQVCGGWLGDGGAHNFSWFCLLLPYPSGGKSSGQKDIFFGPNEWVLSGVAEILLALRLEMAVAIYISIDKTCLLVSIY